ncbi:DUF6056 family protein [Butyrivibrio sp. AD3002]|uniref:DUF6056 family protein n=1 Tax=Butyrivibrio sp. AD3002 TaxID=1280670 RepID=UPI0003B48A75|nr:DUF6056 family protein [Butyrivibrio sp. AD3002]
MKLDDKRCVNKVKKYICDNACVIVIFSLFLFYLIMQHHLVGMYFDDFGNSSLSYAYDSSNIEGTNYSVKDILQWAAFIYKNWSGRVIYALMLIPLQKNGPHLFMLVQAVIIILTYIVSVKLLKLYYKETNKILAALVFIAGYGLIKGDTLSNGYYWASASVLYVWPLLPFVCSVYFYELLIRKVQSGDTITFKDWWMLIIFLPLTILSQEQLGGGFFVWVLFRAGVDLIWGTKWKGNIFIIVSSLLLLALMILAPGNFARMGTNTEYVELPFVERIGHSFDLLLKLLNHGDMLWFNLLLAIFGMVALFSLVNKMNVVAWAIELFLMAPCVVVKIIEAFTNIVIDKKIVLSSFFVFHVVLCVVIVEVFLIYKIPEFIPIMMAAISSVYCLLIAPTFSLRQCIPYVFLSVLFINLLFQILIRNTKVVKQVLFCVVTIALIVGLRNMASVYYKYEKNFFADSMNRSILRNYNGNSDEIYLLNYDNQLGRGMMSCDEGFENTDVWMKEYYNIPADVKIVWKDVSEILSSQ